MRLSILIFALIPSIVFAVNIPNPYKHFLSKWGPGLISENAKKLITFEKDVNGDGILDVFITTEKYRSGKQGYVWYVYISSDGSYIEASSKPTDRLTFYPEGVYYGKIDEIGKVGFMTYFPGSATEGSLIAYYFDSGNIIENKIGDIRPGDKDVELYHKYFNKDVRGINVITQDFASAFTKYTQEN